MLSVFSNAMFSKNNLKTFLLLFTLFREKKKRRCSSCFCSSVLYVIFYHALQCSQASFHLHEFFIRQLKLMLCFVAFFQCESTVLHWSLSEFFPFLAFCTLSLLSHFNTFFFFFLHMLDFFCFLFCGYGMGKNKSTQGKPMIIHVRIWKMQE